MTKLGVGLVELVHGCIPGHRLHLWGLLWRDAFGHLVHHRNDRSPGQASHDVRGDLIHRVGPFVLLIVVGLAAVHITTDQVLHPLVYHELVLVSALEEQFGDGQAKGI